jgi:hypothetical protein
MQAGAKLAAAPDGGEAWAMLSGEVDGWAARSAPGDRVTYAQGSLPKWATGPARMRALAEAGAVSLFQNRIDGVCHYIAVRRDRPLPQAKVPARVSKATVGHDGTARLLSVLKTLAAKKRPCPTNRELAKLADLTDERAASYRLRCLRDTGLIRIHEIAQEPGRLITIASSGRTTGCVIRVAKEAIRK